MGNVFGPMWAKVVFGFFFFGFSRCQRTVSCSSSRIAVGMCSVSSSQASVSNGGSGVMWSTVGGLVLAVTGGSFVQRGSFTVSYVMVCEIATRIFFDSRVVSTR